MKIAVLFLILLAAKSAPGQSSPGYKPRIEPCDCPVKIDSSFGSFCAYLVVPENRRRPGGNRVKLPFIVVKARHRTRQDAVLFTGGGPGNSSLGWAQGVTKGDLVADRDCIAFEQRGTRYALPYLRSFELDTAIKEAYRKNLDKDSMVIAGVKRYKKRLQEKGIDLAGYNTDETVSDIHDLIAALKLDSVNLVSGSYGGGLLLAVLRKDASKIRSLVLDSPLPTFIPIDEQEPANFIEALNQLFASAAKDSADVAYRDLKAGFHQYFSSIRNKRFVFPYLERNARDSIRVEYTKNELLDIINHAMQDAGRLKQVPAMIKDIISGYHRPYVQEKLDNVFLKNQAPDGMRISVYCADQGAYNDSRRLEQLYAIYPYLRGYHVNDVYKAMCDCWGVPPVKPSTKEAFYSGKPVLLGDGAMDPACRPLYMDLIAHYMPNSQRFLFTKRSHGAFGFPEGRAIVKKFLDDPFRKVEVSSPAIIAY